MEIILVRHGQPKHNVNSTISAAGFSQWVRAYNKSDVSCESIPPVYLLNKLTNFFVVSSDLNRAIHSAVLCVDKTPDLMLKELREMDIPRFKLPLQLKANHWLILSRVFWLLNFHGQVESFKQAKYRAKLAASKLVDLANVHGKVVFFGHGLINQYVAKELISLGWDGRCKKQDYWGVMEFKTSEEG